MSSSHKNPVCEKCSECLAGGLCVLLHRNCLVCEAPFCGNGYNYYDKHFCSVICMRTQRTIDIESETKLSKEREKI